MAYRGPEEIQAALRAFAAKWSGYTGTEKSEAQSFLNDLFACYGSDRFEVGARFEEFVSSTGFMDLFWPGVLIVEMKRPGAPLSKAADQRIRYWEASENPAEGIGLARYVIACNFRTVEIWEPGRYRQAPRASIDLADLPDYYDALYFLTDGAREPVFTEHRRELTIEAAGHVSALHRSLVERDAAPSEELTRFVIQTVWCLFAEDLGMLVDYPLQRVVDDLLRDSAPEERSARDLGYLFRLLNQKGDQNRAGAYAGTRYVNGDLFAQPAEVPLNRAELSSLRDAARFDWRKVDPTIFGSLLEGVLGDKRRWEVGAHYTHEVDILKIVGPTIVRPWRERIAATTTPAQAVALLDELCAFRVLDPACGCGNFLYVAYRELRALEAELKLRIADLAGRAGLPAPTDLPYYPLANLYGIDIEGVAVQISRVTLWMGQRQMIERFGPAEPPLPLVDLSGIRQDDALRTPWPRVEAIVGNPPFLGDRKIRAAMGGVYVEWLKAEFGVGVVDFSAYWFRRAVAHLGPGQRAGFVSTNTLRENKHRLASLDHVVQSGGVITDAVSSERWPGDAKVHVSLTNWVQSPPVPPTVFTLDGVVVEGITSQLRAGGTSWEPVVLLANRGRSFIGCQPTGTGFLLADADAEALRAHAGNTRWIRRYVTGEDIANDPEQSPRRWIIDFGTASLEVASGAPDVLRVLRERVRPEREANENRDLAKTWWQFWRPRPEMRLALRPLDRFIASTATGKRLLVSWQAPEVCPSNATVVFAFDDDVTMGILLSRAHEAWAWARSSTMKGDLRYTPSTVFATFPFPDPATPEQRTRVAEASRALYSRRSALCAEHQIGLTKLYNLLDDGAFADLAALHLALDRAVVAAYGWPAAVAQDAPALVRLLTERNQEISEGRRGYVPFG